MSVDVAVLGAGGTIAAAIVRDLAESEEVERLRLLDLDAERAAQVARDHGAGKASSAGVDARLSEGDQRLAAALDGCDVLVNSASYRVNLDAMEAALQAGCHYMDLGGLYWLTARQLELHARFERAGRLGLLGIGSSPGKTNVMAAAAVARLAPDPVRAIHVSAASRDPASRAANGAGPLRVPYALQTLLDEITLAPVVLRDGEPVEIEALAPGGTVRFAAVIGEAQTIHTLHSELQTFGSSFGCSECSFRLSLPGPMLDRLRGLVDASPEQIAATARDAQRQSAHTVSCHVVEASSMHRRVKVIALTEPMPGWNLGGGVVSTAAPAAAAVRLLARDRITATGVHPPETCIEPADLFTELEGRACRFEVHQQEISAPAAVKRDR